MTIKRNLSKSSQLLAIALFVTVACQPASDGSDSATNTRPLEGAEAPTTATTPEQMQDTTALSTDSLSNPTVPN
jgi:hypothetical protein